MGMQDWKTRFEQHNLSQGRTLVLNDQVKYYQKAENSCSATVIGKTSYGVMILLEKGQIHRMHCSCPVAKGGRNCAHMAAVLYYQELEEQAEKERKSIDALREEWKTQEENGESSGTTKTGSRAIRQTGVTGRVAKTDTQTTSRARKTKAQRLEEAQIAAAERDRQIAEEAAKRKAEQKNIQQEEERNRKRQEREERKRLKAEKEAENRRRIAEALEAENQKRIAEEERRAKIREQKAEEARRKEEKRKQEQEAARLLAERRKKEEAKKLREQKKREEEERRQEQQRLEEERKEQERLEAEQRARERDEMIARAERADRANRYTLLGEEWQTEGDEWNGSGSLTDLEEYRYYDALQIEKSMKLTAKEKSEGEKVLRSGKLQIDDITSGFNSTDGQVMGGAFATANPGVNQFPVKLYFTKNRIVGSRCECSQCRSFVYYWRNEESHCAYKSGLLVYLTDYLKKHNLGDTTDWYANDFLRSFSAAGKRSGAHRTDSGEDQKELTLVPRMIKKEGKLSLSFKYGEDKLFVIKKLDEFCKHVKNAELAQYGSKTELAHDLQRFSEEGKRWFRLIQQVVQEEQAIGAKLEDYGYDMQRIVSSGNSIDLTGWRMDSVYGQMKQFQMPFEDWDVEPKQKCTLTCGEKNPELRVLINPDTDKKGKQFQGILVTIQIPEIYPGTDAAYYIEDKTLWKISKEYYQKLEPVHKKAADGSVDMRIGRNNLTTFYYHVLPQLQEIAQIIETDAELIRTYLIPKPQYSFYLDADSGAIFCRAMVTYDGREFDLLKDIDSGDFEDSFRDTYSEWNVHAILTSYLKYYDPQACMLHNNGEEEDAYRLFMHGLDQLREIGEVYCTPQFLNQKKVRKLKASVGVSVSEGMLDLKITTEDLNEEELLDILSSYRQKKKFYRLKDGSFVDLEDQNLRTMAELAEILRLKPSDLKKDHLRLPMFRGLYLDKLLESNDELYEDRDATLRRMSAQFRTIENADYEVPKSLKKIMRGYQKEGFKWLKTLESWGFGGILADEMGLGKTLQAISLLLNLKTEGKQGTSLIVCPASLVYNWEEELHRFAPALTVQTITGTQEERAGLLDNIEKDVLVTSYDLLKRDIVHYEKKQFLVEIIDEAQYIKNHTTAAAKSVKVIQSRIRFALTGTPVENRLSELWSIFDYLMPGFLYGYEVFRRDYENPIVKNEDEEKMQRLQKLTGPFILRRRKEDVLKDLPEKLEEVRYVRLEKKQQQIYDGQVVRLKRQIGAQSDQEFNQSRLQILAELTRLRQICCDPSLCLEKYDGETAKTEACMDLIRGAIDGGHRMLIFSQFTSMLEILERYLQKEDIAYFVLTGSTSKEERRNLVKQFNEGDVPVFLISLKAGGVGLNLTGADIVIHYDPWWNLAAQNQATDRAHRIGQTKKVTVYKLIAKDTIEEKILMLQEKKKQLADQILSGESGQLASLSKEELLDILESDAR